MIIASLIIAVFAEKEMGNKEYLPLKYCGRSFSQSANELRDLPPSINNFLKKKFTKIANPNEEYQSNDYIKNADLPSVRFKGAIRIKYSWYIDYEIGGWHQNFVIRFTSLEMKTDKSSFYTFAPGAKLSGPPCAALNALSMGVRSPVE